MKNFFKFISLTISIVPLESQFSIVFFLPIREFLFKLLLISVFLCFIVVYVQQQLTLQCKSLVYLAAY